MTDEGENKEFIWIIDEKYAECQKCKRKYPIDQTGFICSTNGIDVFCERPNCMGKVLFIEEHHKEYLQRDNKDQWWAGNIRMDSINEYY